jgi:hypothetical protein
MSVCIQRADRGRAVAGNPSTPHDFARNFGREMQAMTLKMSVYTAGEPFEIRARSTIRLDKQTVTLERAT